MSVEATSMAWAWHHPDMTPLRKLVLVRIGDHARPDGSNAYPSVRTLAENVNASRRGVQECLRWLEEVGAISVVVGGGRNGTNCYTVHPCEGGALSAQGAHSAAGGGALSDKKGRTQFARTITNRHRTAPTDADRTNLAAAISRERNMGRMRGTVCPDCEGTGIVLDDSGAGSQCRCAA